MSGRARDPSLTHKAGPPPRCRRASSSPRSCAPSEALARRRTRGRVSETARGRRARWPAVAERGRRGALWRWPRPGASAKSASPLCAPATPPHPGRAPSSGESRQQAGPRRASESEQTPRYHLGVAHEWRFCCVCFVGCLPLFFVPARSEGPVGHVGFCVATYISLFYRALKKTEEVRVVWTPNSTHHKATAVPRLLLFM